ncbi:hypothetical protein PspLS_01585 [Pyricularia sp. CBS 133598]|nr:hypothetical protein PspLS_01585 [Pyricularia sp. CBS 133598]
MIFSKSMISILLATFAHLSLATAENAKDRIKVNRGDGGGKRLSPPKKTKTKPAHQPVPTHPLSTGNGFGGGNVDSGYNNNTDKTSVGICSGCTDPGYPFCRWAYVLFDMQVGQNPEFTYLCANHCGANSCLPNCENCMSYKRDLSNATTRTLEAELFKLEHP